MKTAAAIAWCVLLLFLLPITLTAQEPDRPQPDRWRGLILDESTYNDAVRVLGQPSSDKQKTKDGKTARYIEFKKPEGFDRVGLQFINGKLAVIMLLKPKTGIAAKDLSTIYGLEFDVKVSGISQAFEPGNYERNQGKVYPKTFPAVYELIAATERTTLQATISNGSFGSIMKGSMGVPDTELPGKVMAITMQSRLLVNVKGADALK